MTRMLLLAVFLGGVAGGLGTLGGLLLFGVVGEIAGVGVGWVLALLIGVAIGTQFPRQVLGLDRVGTNARKS